MKGYTEKSHLSHILFGFRKGLDIREPLFTRHVLIQGARDVGCEVFACFDDFEKAFDNVEEWQVDEWQVLTT